LNKSKFIHNEIGNFYEKKRSWLSTTNSHTLPDLLRKMRFAALLDATWLPLLESQMCHIQMDVGDYPKEQIKPY
jgi:hypothetical protein